MAKLKPAMPIMLSRPTAPVTTGRNGRRFHAPRAPQGFIDDPPGFQTEKDPRGKSSDVWFDLPQPSGTSPFRMDLSTVLTAAQIAQIEKDQRMVFHSVGDTGGVNTTTYQQQVATFMELDIEPGLPGRPSPRSSIISATSSTTTARLSTTTGSSTSPTCTIPVPSSPSPAITTATSIPTTSSTSRPIRSKGFVRNFCAQAPIHLPEASDAPRDAMTQPNVYWTLTTPLATIIGLYTNVPEGGKIGPDQISWFEKELAAAAPGKALILALHHPIYSAYGAHPGSQYLKSIIENAAKLAGRTPDLILTGHVHNYQRFTGSINGKPVPTIVAGAGGYNQKLHTLKRPTFDPTKGPYKFPDGPETLDKFNDFQHGYLILDVTPGKIACSYIAVNDPKAGDPVPARPLDPYDTFEVLVGR